MNSQHPIGNMQHLLKQILQTHEDIETLIRTDQCKTQQLEALETEKRILQGKLEALSQEKTQLIAIHNTLAKENDTLQSHINNFKQQYIQKLAEAKAENELLLLHLHQTQEALEQYILRQQADQVMLDKQSKRLKRLHDRHSDYWDYETLTVTPLENNAQQQILQWHLTDLYLGDRHLPELRFKTYSVSDLAGIIIQRTGDKDSPAPFLRWPTSHAKAEELPCIPVEGPTTYGNNILLSSLGTTDWDTLQLLTKQLIGFLAEPAHSGLPWTTAVTLRSGLFTLQKILSNWPKTPRFDSVHLQKTLHEGAYRGLAIRLDGLSLGEQHWPEQEYRLATITEPGHIFGQNLRLEFPEIIHGALKNWFEENNGKDRAHLKLHFTQPDIMDTRAWSTLAKTDRLLVASIMGTLALQLSELECAHPNVNEPWQEWQTLGQALKKIMLAQSEQSTHRSLKSIRPNTIPSTNS